MKCILIDTPAFGDWVRDCELTAFQLKPLSLEFIKDSDSTSWKIVFQDFIAFKVTSEEFTIHLSKLTEDGAFFVIEDSLWLKELRTIKREILKDCKHYVLCFYDEYIEVISGGFAITKI